MSLPPGMRPVEQISCRYRIHERDGLRPINVVTPTLAPGGPETQARLLVKGLNSLGYRAALHSCEDGVPDVSHGEITIWWGDVPWEEKPPGSVWVRRNPSHDEPPAEMVDRMLDVRQVWNGVDPADWSGFGDRPPGPALSSDHPLRLGYIGRYAAEKRPMLALRAAHRYGHPLYMFGAGPLRDSVFKAAEATGANAEIHGWTTPQAALRGVDVLVIPSEHEGCPSVAIEAMLAGVPVVHMGQGCLSEMCPDGVRGIEARDGDCPAKLLGLLRQLDAGQAEESLGEAVERLHRDRWLWDSIRSNARVYALAHLTADAMAKRYARVIDEMRAPRARVPRDKARLLCLADQPGWAFDNGHRDGEQYMADEFDHTHFLVRDHNAGKPMPDFSEFDLVFCPYVAWNFMAELPMGRTVGALRSRWWPGRSGLPPGDAQTYLANKFRAFQVVNQGAYAELVGSVPNLFKLANPVNMRRFPKPTRVKDVVACWAGNGGRKVGDDDLKGLHSRVIPAVRKTRTPIVYAEFHTRRLAPEEMPGLYQRASVLVHASSEEGHCKVLTEAMASGLAVITTETGTVPEMVEQQRRYYGDTGIMVVRRSVDAIAEALVKLQRQPSRLAHMGRLNRMLVQEFWSWDVWHERYREFLRRGL